MADQHQKQLRVEEKRARREVKRALRRRSFLFQITGLGLGVAAGEGLYAVGSGQFGKTTRAIERSLIEFYEDYQALTGTLESSIKRERQEMEVYYSAHQEDLQRLDVPPTIDTQSLEELINHLKVSEIKYGLLERLIQFKDRVDLRILSLDRAVENLSPDVMRRFNDFFRGLHGKPTGEAFQQQRDALIAKLELLTRAYAANEDTRQTELTLVKEINAHFENIEQILDDPELESLRGEFRNQIEQLNELPDDLGWKKIDPDPAATPETLPPLEARTAALLEERAGEYLALCTRLNAVLEESRETRRNLQEGEALVDAVRGQRLQQHLKEQYTDEKPESFLTRIKQLEQAVQQHIQRLEQLGYPVTTRKERIERDTVSRAVDSAVDGTFGGFFSGPVRWAAWIGGGLLGLLIGRRFRHGNEKKLLTRQLAEIKAEQRIRERGERQ